MTVGQCSEDRSYLYPWTPLVLFLFVTFRSIFSSLPLSPSLSFTVLRRSYLIVFFISANARACHLIRSPFSLSSPGEKQTLRKNTKAESGARGGTETPMQLPRRTALNFLQITGPCFTSYTGIQALPPGSSSFLPPRSSLFFL